MFRGAGSSRSVGAVLLDVDGTLVDNSYFHAIAWWRACRDFGELVPMARLHRLIGMGSDQLIQTLFHRDWPELSAAHGGHIAPFFDEMLAFDGAAELLRELAARGLGPVLASSAEPEELERLQSIVGAADAVAGVTSNRDAGASKPAPDIFSVALQRAGVPPDRALAVGDTGWDVAAAGGSGVECITVESGGWSGAELRHAGATAVYSDVGQLLAGLDRSPIARLAAR